MKPPEQWTEPDLLEMIKEKREESVDLDFKSADALGDQDSKKKDISKDVSAFANSVGGVLIYGMAESDQEPHTADKLEPIDPADFSKEKLENVITSRIHPRISVHINPIGLATQFPGKFVYVVVVPQSDTAHQASDKKYYKRFNFKSEPMEDYEVRQTMNRASRAFYTLQLRVGTSTTGNETKAKFSAIVENRADRIGRELSVVLFAPKELVREPDEHQPYSYQGVEYTRIAGNFIESSRVTRTSIPSAAPLAPYSFSFLKSIVFRSDLVSARRFTLFAKVFDEFGLALSCVFTVSLPNCEIERISETPSGQRAPGILGVAELG